MPPPPLLLLLLLAAAVPGPMAAAGCGFTPGRVLLLVALLPVDAGPAGGGGTPSTVLLPPALLLLVLLAPEPGPTVVPGCGLTLGLTTGAVPLPPLLVLPLLLLLLPLPPEALPGPGFGDGAGATSGFITPLPAVPLAALPPLLGCGGGDLAWVTGCAGLPGLTALLLAPLPAGRVGFGFAG